MRITRNAVVASDLRESTGTEGIAARIRERLAEPFSIDGEMLQVTSSVGASIYPDDGADYEVLMKNADIALYESKDNGRDRYTLFDASMIERVSNRLALERDLRDAIRDGQFFVEYQPLLDLRTRQVASLEALMRWNHPERGRIPPLEFIDIAEKAGLIADIGAFVVAKFCRQIGAWQRAGVAPVPVAVNVSTRQFERHSIVDLIHEATQASGIDPSLLHVELTESAFMEERERNVGVLEELRVLGIEVSVDDFGTGYSSLAYLRDLPIDCLKIDHSFVAGLGTDEGDAIVEAIVRMAQSPGVSTVADVHRIRRATPAPQRARCDLRPGLLLQQACWAGHLRVVAAGGRQRDPETRRVESAAIRMTH
jgi:predicted signal transduction protein with EAL and GGDEF domain